MSSACRVYEQCLSIVSLEVPYYGKIKKYIVGPSWPEDEIISYVGTRILLGLCNDQLARRDEFISEELTNHLFQVIK